MSLPQKSDIAEHWKSWLDENGFDWGEPSCWACKKWWDTKNDLPTLPGKSVSSGWDKAPLQRCHIVPKSLGGADTVDNLFLMCKECHDLAPNTPSRNAFLKWASKQHWTVRMFGKINSDLSTFDFEVQDYEWILSTLQDDAFKKWAEDKIGLHRNQQDQGIQITASTLLALLYEYMNLQS